MLLGTGVTRSPSSKCLDYVDVQHPLHVDFPLFVFVVVFLGKALASSQQWTTVPLPRKIAGAAVSTATAAMLVRRIGRQRGSFIGFGYALTGTALAFRDALIGNFWLFLASAVLMGTNLAFTVQIRFAALESLKDPTGFPLALSVLMLGGLVTAFL